MVTSSKRILPKVIFAIRFVLNEPEKVKSGQQRRRQLDILFHGFLGIVAAECRVCRGEDRHSGIEACHDPSLQYNTQTIHYTFYLQQILTFNF